MRERTMRGAHKARVDEIAGRGTSDDVDTRDEGPGPCASVMLPACQRSYDRVEPCGYQLYKFVAIVNLGFGELPIFRAGVGNGNDSGFHEISIETERTLHGLVSDGDSVSEVAVDGLIFGGYRTRRERIGHRIHPSPFRRNPQRRLAILHRQLREMTD